MVKMAKGRIRRRSTSGFSVAAVTLVGALTLVSAAIGCSDDDPIVVTDSGLPDADNTTPGGPQLRTVQPFGIRPQGSQCGDLSSGEASMSLVLLDDHGRPVTDGGVDLSFSDGRLYSLPDVECGDCGGSLSCEAHQEIGDRCGVDTGLSITDGPTPIGTQPQSQAIAVAISDVGRWRGWYSGDFAGYHEFNPNGPNEALRNDPIQEVAVDRDHIRETALRDMADDWGRLVDRVSDDGREALFGLWTYGEISSEVISRIENSDPSGSMWTTEPVVAETASGTAMPSVRQGRSDIYNSIIEILDQGFAADAEAGSAEEQSLVVIVSGHDERQRADVDQVIGTANSLGVSVSIVQVDAPRNVDYLRDDWVYYEEQSPCSSDGDCANFEECREPTRYTTNSSTDDEFDVDYPTADQLGNSYCLPAYDENGRIGPIAEFDRLACETGGSYTYVPAADRTGIHNPLQGAVFAAEAAWEFDFSIDDVAAYDPGASAHFLEATLEATMGTAAEFSFTHDGNLDTRGAVITAGD